MYKDVLQSIEGIGIYPIISFIIFFTFFIGLIFWLIKADKNYIIKMKQMPLDSNKGFHNNSTGEVNEN